uniref:Uncharacterized protein n=1 Tax=viral metagenome TaxID=1070528 RepID=A0A6M3IUR0_9ZZZZ
MHNSKGSVMDYLQWVMLIIMTLVIFFAIGGRHEHKHTVPRISILDGSQYHNSYGYSDRDTRQEERENSN